MVDVNMAKKGVQADAATLTSSVLRTRRQLPVDVCDVKSKSDISKSATPFTDSRSYKEELMQPVVA
jgi:hypothetical protein